MRPVKLDVTGLGALLLVVVDIMFVVLALLRFGSLLNIRSGSMVSSEGEIWSRFISSLA